MTNPSGGAAGKAEAGDAGVGREHGEDGFREYLQAKTIASPADR